MLFLVNDQILIHCTGDLSTAQIKSHILIPATVTQRLLARGKGSAKFICTLKKKTSTATKTSQQAQTETDKYWRELEQSQ